MNGSEPVDSECVRRFSEHFAPAGFRPAAMCPVYRLAEGVLATTFPPLGVAPRFERVDRATLVSAGRAVPAAAGVDALALAFVGRAVRGIEIRIVDENGAEVAERHQGHILLRGTSVTAGYLNDPRARAEVWKDGWLHTGDLGYMVEGDLFVCGRAKDLIVRAGRKYHPYDIERSAEGIAGVQPGCVAAFGVYNPEKGIEDLILVLAATANGGTPPVELIRQVTSRVWSEVGIPPDRICVVPRRMLPRTSSGKIQRSKLRHQYLSGVIESREVRHE